MSAVGIDYSMTCPAACFWQGTSPLFWFAHDSKLSPATNVTRDNIPDLSVTRRAAALARHCTDWLFYKCPDVKRVAIEDYAFAATGRVFHIGENTGILKHMLDNYMIEYVPVSPSAIKKFATGKGNADKPKMVAAFLDAYPDAHAWIPKLFPRTKGVPAKSPLADLADAYWLARYSFEKP